MSAAEHHRDDIALAGEYALGLLEGDERAAFEARLAREPELAALVEEWQARFAALAEEVDPVAPPDRVKAAIDARLFGEGKAAARVLPFRRRWALGAALALAASIAALAFLGLFTGPGETRLVAEVVAEDRALVVAAEAELRGDGGELVARLVTGAPPPDRAFELWLIPQGADRPISMGLIAPDAPARARLTAELASRLAGATLAISTEPPGGSPTGQPTGPVVAAGQLTRPG
ncbi:anti-sigma factor [Oceanicella actignis]|uniref:Regulator of SigK n=1 Tax=Oceanicella actignis TaxID=1189325 RepID=A0A1M7U517_9RHOB|nr:anti-sigma factor [Oceanicella actignis]SET89832.1 Anti-sigma-K factor RskA [Oceanicella actignis]SHN78192.1 Anti-sigma-K factor RskA [Oceanicella actignis]